MKRQNSTTRRFAITALLVLLLLVGNQIFRSADEDTQGVLATKTNVTQMNNGHSAGKALQDSVIQQDDGHQVGQSSQRYTSTQINDSPTTNQPSAVSPPHANLATQANSDFRGPGTHAHGSAQAIESWLHDDARAITSQPGHLHTPVEKFETFENQHGFADDRTSGGRHLKPNNTAAAEFHNRPKPKPKQQSLAINQIPPSNEIDFKPRDIRTAKTTSPRLQSAPNWLEDDQNATVHDSAVQGAALTTLLPEPPPTPQSGGVQGTTKYRLADGPKIGGRYKSETPIFDNCAVQTETFLDDFSPDAIDPNLPYDPFPNQQVYEGKQLNANQRPLLELGQPWYQLGQLAPGNSLLGFHNSVNPQLVVFGDYRNAIASNTVNGNNVSQIAWEMNTFWSLFVTGTERVVWGIAPFDNGGGNTRWLLDDDRFEFEGDVDFDFGYLEGDLGAIAGGFMGETLPFDLPFAAGLTPLFLQNGIWLNDALEGVFATIPARNSPKLNISNMDITFAYVYDNINSAAFEGDNSAAKAYAIFLFIEALNGYFEIDYAFLEDRDIRDRSYHNIGLAFTRRFGRFISHSSRVIVNAGQDVAFGDQTADGVLLLSENSLITRNPYTVVPYFNFFAGFDTPQSFAGDQELVNTGILFESDGMTGYPTLDGRAQDTFGYAFGLNLIAQDFSQQLILETAAVFRNDDSDLPGDQYGIGMRYQLPLTNSWIFRTDAMYGFFRDDDDDAGMRVELRKKF